MDREGTGIRPPQGMAVGMRLAMELVFVPLDYS